MTLTEYTTELLSSAWLNGKYHVSEQYKQLPAIVTVEADDLAGDDAAVAARLYIAEEDVPELRTQFALGLLHEENTVLFRFSTSTYDCQYAGAYIIPDSNTELPREGVLVGTYIPVFRFTNNNYDATQFDEVLISETVYLDFDIISLTFKDEEGAETVLPVVASPIDAIAGYTPPLDTNYHSEGDGDSTWIWIVIAIVLVVVVILLLIFCPQVFVLLFKAIFLCDLAALPRDRGARKGNKQKPRRQEGQTEKGQIAAERQTQRRRRRRERRESREPARRERVRWRQHPQHREEGGRHGKSCGTSETAAQGKRAGNAKAVKTAGSKAAGGEKKRAARRQSSKNVTARGGERKTVPATGQTAKTSPSKRTANNRVHRGRHALGAKGGI